MASMLSPVNDSLYAWFVEIVVIGGLWSRCRLGKAVSKPCRWYILFVCWSVVSLSYSAAPLRGVRSLAMYVFPLFFYALTMISLKDKAEVFALFHKLTRSTRFFALLGCFALLVGQFNTIQVYYGMTISTIPLLLYIRDREKKEMLFLMLCAVPSLLLVKRTPLLGMAASVTVFSFLIYRIKALMPTILTLVFGVLLVLSIPQFREKLFFGGDDMSVSDIAMKQDVSQGFNTNGRDVFWVYLLDEFFLEHPITGVGTGTVKEFVQSDNNIYVRSFFLVHNDWLLISCETGLIGASLLLLFFLSVFVRCFRCSSRRFPIDVRLVSAMCAGSATCTVIHMFFENCMNSFVFPIFFAMYALFHFYTSKRKTGVTMCHTSPKPA